MPAPLETTFAFQADPRNLARTTPSWRLARLLLVRRQLERIFDFRARAVREVFGSARGQEAK